jgi:TolB-like protein
MIYKFEKFELDTSRFELRADGTPLKAEPQVLALLVFLVENPGRLVSKDEIYDSVWNGRFVSDAALSSRIKSARQLVSDDGREQRLIQTVHKKGFRFVGDLSSELAAKKQPVENESITTDYERHEKPSIAVLPFSNLSNESEQAYFADGISSDIINHLSKHRWLSVTARNTSFGYRDKIVDVVKLGVELGLDYVVDGSVQKSGQQVRISVQLIDAKTGHQIWADRYDRVLSDIFVVQDEITEKIVARLEPEIGVAERYKVIVAKPPDLQAWEAYHLGIHHFFRFTSDDNLLAQSYLKRSQELDPLFGEAFAWWAYAVTLGMVYWATEPSPKLLDEALVATNRSIQLDSRNASFYALKARVLLARQEYQSAIQENKKAIALNPTFAAAHCGLGDSLAYEGKYEESLDCFEKAIALSPNDPQIWAFYTYGALAMIFMGEYHRAVEWTEKALSIPNCQYWANAHQLVANVYLGEETAIATSKAQLLEEVPDFTVEFARSRLFYLKDQQQTELYLKALITAGLS